MLLWAPLKPTCCLTLQMRSKAPVLKDLVVCLSALCTANSNGLGGVFGESVASSRSRMEALQRSSEAAPLAGKSHGWIHQSGPPVVGAFGGIESTNGCLLQIHWSVPDSIFS